MSDDQRPCGALKLKNEFQQLFSVQTPDDQTLPTIPIQWSSPVDPLLTIIPASHGRLFGGSDIGQRPPSV